MTSRILILVLLSALTGCATMTDIRHGIGAGLRGAGDGLQAAAARPVEKTSTQCTSLVSGSLITTSCQ